MLRRSPGKQAAFRFVWLVGLFLLPWLTIACRNAQPPSLPPEEIVRNAADRMNAMPGFHFIIDRTGAPAYLDSGESLSFRRAEGDYVAPDRSRAIVRIIAPGLVTDVSVISVADIQWETNLLTGQWEELPPDWGFNPTVLFDAEIGLQAILTSDMSNLGPVEIERLDDVSDQRLYAVSGGVAGERLYQMSGGLIGPEPVTVKLWIMPETFELQRIYTTEPAAGADEPSVWQVDFANFDQVVTIEPPIVEQD
jgi:lipoprotein LprG